METYSQEIKNYYSQENEITKKAVFLNSNETININDYISQLREWRSHHAFFHFCMELFPFSFFIIIFSSLYYFTLNSQLPIIFKIIIFTIVHGIFSYQYVVYTLHEAGGHGILRKFPSLSQIFFHSSRLFFADPIYYRRRHTNHHNYLGTEQDGAFTHFVLPQRILISMLPGAGVFFKNNYKIAQDEKFTPSMFFSLLTGLSFVAIQAYILGSLWSVGVSFIILIVLSPWIAMILDRTRESVEHQGMPNNKKMGAKELGLGPLALLIGGGPWGQPCHFSHHYAPDLSWYQQILLHKFILKNTSDEFLNFYGFSKTTIAILRETFIFYKNYWQENQFHKIPQESL
ncbi:MAG: fatty acid desaturase [Halobacteriovoraceae bacterium]|nr:fatty acid desaturase [Halobacteriovoraceae bacterium]MCB9094097.1 fatty acid desaturase [Halobacteriovoraceae bacterium]